MNKKLNKGMVIILVFLICAVLFFVIRKATTEPAETNTEPEQVVETIPAETEPVETDPSEIPEADTENEEDSGTYSQKAEENVVIEIEEDSGYIIE